MLAGSARNAMAADDQVEKGRPVQNRRPRQRVEFATYIDMDSRFAPSWRKPAAVDFHHRRPQFLCSSLNVLLGSDSVVWVACRSIGQDDLAVAFQVVVKVGSVNE